MENQKEKKEIRIKKIDKTAFQDPEHSAKEIHIVDLIPNVMDNVVIMERRGEHILNIPSSMDGMKFKKWLRSPGGVLSTDFLRWLRNKSEAQYLLISAENIKTVIRLINSHELSKFESRNLINGKIKDSYYMHLKSVNIDESLHGESRYIEEITDNLKEDLIPIVKDKNIEDEENHSYYSESLFE